MASEVPRSPLALLPLLLVLSGAPAASALEEAALLHPWRDTPVDYAYVGVSFDAVAGESARTPYVCWSVEERPRVDTSSGVCWDNRRMTVVEADSLLPAEVIVGFVVAGNEVCVMVYRYGAQQCTLCREEERHDLVCRAWPEDVPLLP